MDIIGGIKGLIGMGNNNNSQPQASTGTTVVAQAGSTVNIGKTGESEGKTNLSGNSPLANSINPSSADKSSIGKGNSNKITISFNDTPIT